jgi:hypothetical protein
MLQVLRILTVVAMGWVVAHSAAQLLRALVGRVPPNGRERLSDALVGLGAFGIGWGWLQPGTTGWRGALPALGALLFAVGILVRRPGHTGV